MYKFTEDDIIKDLLWGETDLPVDDLYDVYAQAEEYLTPENRKKLGVALRHLVLTLRECFAHPYILERNNAEDVKLDIEQVKINSAVDRRFFKEFDKAIKDYIVNKNAGIQDTI